MRRERHELEAAEDVREELEVRELLLGLAQVEARGLEGACRVQGLPAVDAGRLAVERLREDEAEDLAVRRILQVEARVAEVVTGVLELRQHRADSSAPTPTRQLERPLALPDHVSPRLTMSVSLFAAFCAAAARPMHAIDPTRITPASRATQNGASKRTGSFMV